MTASAAPIPITTEELKGRVEACLTLFDQRSTPEEKEETLARQGLNYDWQLREFVMSCMMLKVGYEAGRTAPANIS